jgi:hypothetical protein
MRRALVPLTLIVLAAGYLIFTWPRTAHISELVPGDFAFGVFARSLDDLGRLYEGPHARKDSDPARSRFGAPCNVPGLDGVDYELPAGSFWTKDLKEEVFLIPVRKIPPFEDAFERERENIRVREPERVAKSYLSLSQQPVRARRGPRNDLVLDAASYPLAVCGHPRDGAMLTAMLAYLLAREAPRKPDLPLLIQHATRMPKGVADTIARQCEEILLGFPLPETLDAPVRVEGKAALVPTGIIARSAHFAGEADLTNMVASFPHNTVLLLGLVLDAPGWQEVGLPLPLGNAAFACGLVEERIHARRFTVLLAARALSPHDRERLQEQGLPTIVGDTAGLQWTEVDDGGAEVSTAQLPDAPAWLAQVLRSDAEQPPPVYVSWTSERGIWYCAIGSQAEGVVRRALGCLRDTPELGLSRSKPVALHKRFLAGPHVGLAMVTTAGLKAFEAQMPYFEIASLDQPPSVTAVLDVDDGAKLEILIARSEK